MARQFSFCEHVTAVGPWHIREVGPEGIKPSGGAGPALCFKPRGWKWINGWDIQVEITEHHLGHVCPRCVELYRKALKEGTP